LLTKGALPFFPKGRIIPSVRGKCPRIRRGFVLESPIKLVKEFGTQECEEGISEKWVNLVNQIFGVNLKSVEGQ